MQNHFSVGRQCGLDLGRADALFNALNQISAAEAKFTWIWFQKPCACCFYEGDAGAVPQH
jgi:hypothetical protein